MKIYRWLFALSMLVILSLACSMLSGGNGGSEDSGGNGGGSGGSSSGGGSAPSGYDTNFPLPEDASEFTSLGQDAINFQTGLSIDESLAFYREAFTKQGLTERAINTATTDSTFSIVFDGDPSGKALVVQGVDLGNGKTNINIRYEDV